jgi:hypothetical protein
VPAASLVLLLTVGASPAASDTQRAVSRAPAPSEVLARLVQAVGGRGASQNPQRYEYLRKLDSHLQDVAASGLGAEGATNAGMAARRQGVTVSSQGDVSVDVYVKGDIEQAADELRAVGMLVTAVTDRAPQRMVEGFLPPDALAKAAALTATRAIVAPFMRVNAGSVISQGDGAIHGPQARAFGPFGPGVSVGIISDSIDQVGGGISDSQSTGDLPANVQNLGDQPGGSDEGRAMAEIVYDEAPGISGIVFSTAAGGPAAKANTIDNLVIHGVRVIADDTAYPTEPFFQDGIVSQAVDRAKAAGVAYFSSAGNDGRNSWEGTYAPVGDPSAQSTTTEDFDPGAAVDTVQTVGTIPAGGDSTLVLQWAEPWGHATTDLAIDFYEISAGAPAWFGTVDTSNLVTGIPMEATGILAGSSPLTFGIAIRRVAGTGTPFMKYIDFTNGVGTVTIEHATNSGAIDPDAASASGALTVAASRFSTPATPEAFSARGPVTRFFDVNGNPLGTPAVRQKPNLAAPDGVDTSVPGFAPFFGTSAAAPAAAGIAALILSAKPALGVDELYAIMTNPANALDCPAAGNPDPDCGVGFVLADSAVAMVRDTTPPVITPTITPPTSDGANGWYRAPVSVSWSVSDPESPVSGPVGCGPASPGEATALLTCSATSAGGTTSVPVTIKRDSTPPSAPVLTGIGATTYSPAALPAASSIGCSATDPTSGVSSCTITGYGSNTGIHTLTAVATNDAGLAASTVLAYTVAKPAAISRLMLPKGLTLAKLAQSGIPLTVRVATASTRLVVKLVARVPRASGHGTREIPLGSLTKTVSAGITRVRIKLTTKARRQLRNVSKATLKVSVTGSAPGVTGTRLQSSIVVRRLT